LSRLEAFVVRVGTLLLAPDLREPAPLDEVQPEALEVVVQPVPAPEVGDAELGAVAVGEVGDHPFGVLVPCCGPGVAGVRAAWHVAVGGVQLVPDAVALLLVGRDALASAADDGL